VTTKYAVLEGPPKRVIYEIECDCCGATIRPNPDIAQSGWEKRMTYEDTWRGTEVLTTHYCPRCK
jgi:hypothetical protein